MKGYLCLKAIGVDDVYKSSCYCMCLYNVVVVVVVAVLICE